MKYPPFYGGILIAFLCTVKKGVFQTVIIGLLSKPLEV